MDRSLYPDGVLVDSTALTRTEDDAIFHILQRQIDSTSLGVVSGCSITVNAGNATLIDVGTGYGYAPDGELVQIQSTVTALRLADYVLNNINYVVAIYTETTNDLKPHETNGNSYPTSATRNVRVEVLSQAEYSALLASDANLNNDAKDRAMVLAVVTANGVGSPLTNTSIVATVPYSGAISVQNVTNNITGVALVRATTTTPTGSGTLRFAFSAKTLSWTAPGDSSGAPVSIVSDGTYVLPSSPSGDTLTVLVTFTSLPAGDQTDTISISNIYEQTAQRFTSVDIEHRSMVGSGISTTNNPHGMTLADLGVTENVVVDHQDIFHNPGIRRNTNSNTLVATVNHPVAAADNLTFNLPPPSVMEVYLAGAKHSGLVANLLTFTDISDNAQIVFDVYAVAGTNGLATVTKQERIRYAVENPPPSLAAVVQLRDASDTTPIGNGTIQYTYGGSFGTLAFKIDADGVTYGPAIVIPSGSGLGSVMRLFNTSGLYWVDVFVQDWSLWDSGNKLTNISQNVTFSALPTAAQLSARLRLCTIMFSGSATGLLGNGFGVSPLHSPNSYVDKRLFGTTCPDNLRDDSGTWSVLGWSALFPTKPIWYKDLAQLGIGGIPAYNEYVRIKRPAGTDSQLGLVIVAENDGVNTPVSDIVFNNPANASNKRLMQLSLRGDNVFYMNIRNDDFTYSNHTMEVDMANGRIGINASPPSTSRFSVTAGTNETAIVGIGNGTGNGGTFTGGATNGAGISAAGGGTTGAGVIGTGSGTGTGGVFTGGPTASGVGVTGTGGAAGGPGGQFTATIGTYAGVIGTGSGNGAGGSFTGGSGTASGVIGQGTGFGSGGNFTGGSSGAGVSATGISSPGGIFVGDTYGISASSTGTIHGSLFLSPQSVDPTLSSNAGEFYVNETTGKLNGYDGFSWVRYICQVYSTPNGEVISSSSFSSGDHHFDAGYVAHANTFGFGSVTNSTIRVSAVFHLVISVAVSTVVTVSVRFGSTPIITGSFTVASGVETHTVYLHGVMAIDGVGSPAGSLTRSMGEFVDLNVASSAAVVTPYYHKDSPDFTINNTILAYVNFNNALNPSTVTYGGLNVDIVA